MLTWLALPRSSTRQRRSASRRRSRPASAHERTAGPSAGGVAVGGAVFANRSGRASAALAGILEAARQSRTQPPPSPPSAELSIVSAAGGTGAAAAPSLSTV